MYIAINMSSVVNSERSFELMRAVGPKVCILTAGNPGFLGYQAMVQTGVIPMAGRYGGASVRMERELNPVRMYQYTVWDSAESHAAFHRDEFERVFELCAACLSMVVEGPWEPVYEVVHARMPRIRTMGQLAALAQDIEPAAVSFAAPQRSVALVEHVIKPGHEGAFERGVAEVMEALSTSPGFLGYMVLKQVSVNPWGSFMLDPESMVQMLETLGANPPDDPHAAFEAEEARSTPAEYLIHSEWETPELAQQGLGRVLINRQIRLLHNQRVMSHLIRGPYPMIFTPMMEEPAWRERLG